MTEEDRAVDWMVKMMLLPSNDDIPEQMFQLRPDSLVAIKNKLDSMNIAGVHCVINNINDAPALQVEMRYGTSSTSRTFTVTA